MKTQAAAQASLVQALKRYGTFWPNRSGHYDLSYTPDALALIQNDDAFVCARASDPELLAAEIVAAATEADNRYAIDLEGKDTAVISAAIIDLGEALELTFAE